MTAPVLDATEHAPPIDTTVAIEAPEQIRFRYRLAGPAQRGVAHLVDIAIIVALLIVVGIVLAVSSASFSATLNGGEGIARALQGVLLVVLFLVQWGYFALLEGFARGQTPGKRLMRLRVVKNGGEPIGFVDGALRNLLRAADLLPFGYAAGVACMLLDSRFRRLGDLVAGTMVVVEDRVAVAVPLYIVPPTPEEAAGLPARVVLDAEELRTLEMFLRRAPVLGIALAGELAEVLAPAMSRRHGVVHADPVRLLALIYLRATAPLGPRAVRAVTGATAMLRGAA